MRIFLDTRDLIDLLQCDRPCSVHDFDIRLHHGRHQLVLTPSVINEFSYPLLERDGGVVTRHLNALEALPILYMTDACILELELRAAAEAFSTNQVYTDIDPVRSRYDAALHGIGDAPTANRLNYGLAETVFELWTLNPEGLTAPQRQVSRIQRALETWRHDPDRGPKKFICSRIEEELNRLGILKGTAESSTLAKWIYESPRRCPGSRLRYEMMYWLVKNRSARHQRGFFYDFGHVLCLPYVDRITLDRQIRALVQQTCEKNASTYFERMRANAAAVLSDL